MLRVWIGISLLYVNATRVWAGKSFEIRGERFNIHGLVSKVRYGYRNRVVQRTENYKYKGTGTTLDIDLNIYYITRRKILRYCRHVSYPTPKRRNLKKSSHEETPFILKIQNKNAI